MPPSDNQWQWILNFKYLDRDGTEGENYLNIYVYQNIFGYKVNRHA